MKQQQQAKQEECQLPDTGSKYIKIRSSKACDLFPQAVTQDSSYHVNIEILLSWFQGPKNNQKSMPV